jgi:DNA-binding NtrC family response regulator
VTQTILVVEDDLQARELTCRILRDAGYDCVWANTGEHALALLVERREPPDLFVFDVRLPDMPGPTLAWLLSERYGEVPALFVSGYPSFDAALLRAARWDFLAKPFTQEALVAAVRRILSQPDVRTRSAS